MTPAEYKVIECLAGAVACSIVVFVIGLIIYALTEIGNIYWWFLTQTQDQ